MKFCFLCNVSDTLKGRTVGGAELQVCLLSKALVNKGHEVVIIDYEARESFISKDGIQVIHVPGWYEGIKGLRFFLHRIPALYKILKNQKADCYYVRTRSYFHFLSYRAARKNNSKFILALACDLDVLSFREKFKYEYRPKFNLLKLLTLYLPNDIVFNYLLKRADYITLQHASQMKNSSRVKGKQVVVSNIFNSDNISEVSNSTKDYFICVGSLTFLKGVDNLLNLLSIIDPKNKVVIVGKAKDKKAQKIYNQLLNRKNIELKGWLDHAETMRLISNAKALINTSNYEGFPNIFLEAWACGIPVLSLKVNPGNVINEFDLGKCYDGNYVHMADGIDKNSTNNIDRQSLISYIKKFHDSEIVTDKFLNSIN